MQTDSASSATNWHVPQRVHIAATDLPATLAERAACGTGFITHLSAQPAHAIVRDALSIVARLAHRGAVSADGRTGDGSGILTQIPHTLFARELESRATKIPARGDLGVGMLFLPRDESHARAKSIIARAFESRAIPLLAWREAPIDLDALGEHARKTRPQIEQVIVARPAHLDGDAFERALFLARKEIERRAREQELRVYVSSLSARTIVYKGLFVASQLPRFYRDLADPLYESAFALFHQRYSTNTFPTWERAQPFRMLCHNGEINTLQGNLAWMRAREPFLASEMWSHESLAPIIDTDGSDSAMLDNALELLTLSGRDAAHAQMMLMPEAWEKVQDMPAHWKAFYRYHATLMEPWDGPAAVAFSDGRVVGMTLDRNGLRPARYLVTDDGLVVASSEAGALEVDPGRVIEKGKLGPGQMIVADLARGELWHNERVKDFYASRAPYGEWLDANIRTLSAEEQGSKGAEEITSPLLHSTSAPLLTLHAAFGYTDEELGVIVKPMANDGAEPIGSMGDDTPHAVLSDFERPLYHFFRQRFAQVTNPPIDPLREELVMSVRAILGARGNVLTEAPAHARVLELASPILTDDQLDTIRARNDAFPHATLDATFDARDPDALERAVGRVCREAQRAAENGETILILSDRAISATRAPIPMLLAVSAVHHHLLRIGKRWRTSLIAEVGDARDVHQFACLIGFGANALNPYLALASARAASKKDLVADRAEENFVHAAEKGILKIMSKMGIATLDAYHGAQIFEIIGIDHAVVARNFPGTPAHVGGIGLRVIAQKVLEHHAHAFHRASTHLKNYGFFKYKKDGEHHTYNPPVVQTLHAAVRTPGALNGGFREAFAKYRDYVSAVHTRTTEISDHLDIAFGNAIPISRVEPASAIIQRFSAAAMSHGALSLEAHIAMTEALNRLGAKSNSGEGGEAPARYNSSANSRIKQVASGRFGVTPAYLMSADELQIKMAQGSKPGEGGQLPSHKVTAEIAAIRYSQPGIALISPPPHHDIYSIEDLAQLIYDLKRINPRARVSVKLVAESGVGTIAAGVAKAFADIVQISGHSGGTGASPLSSIKHVGAPWEIGLVETQHVLVANDLRGRVRIRVDGGFKTARHVIVAALLGADEFSFGTAPLIASGCVMARACHLNTCPTGIATQKEELRKKFPNQPEWIMAFFQFLAEETREYLAALGARSLDEIIGRVERLSIATRHTSMPVGAPSEMAMAMAE
ncbi:MAG: glutamate synthase large subunit [Chloroflexi bacterium]|nr:glutamate synthase large subunit [Chloroflexota bacterium]